MHYFYFHWLGSRDREYLGAILLIVTTKIALKTTKAPIVTQELYLLSTKSLNNPILLSTTSLITELNNNSFPQQELITTYTKTSLNYQICD